MNRLISAIIVLVMMLSFTTNSFATDVWRNPGPFPEGMDTWYGSDYNTSAQHDYRLRVGGWGDEYDTLIRFDLSGLPQTATQAVLWLYAIDEGTPTHIYWDFLTSQWHSGTVGWNNQPTGVYSWWTSPPTVNSWYGIVVTNEYNSWRSGSTSTPNYGLRLRPVYTNNKYSTFYSSTQGGGYGPWLQVTYTPQADDNIIKLKWPLSTVKPSTPSQGGAFGDSWGNGITKCVGLPMTHTGIDISNNIGNPVYAAEDGIVKEVLPATQTGGWASAIVVEHTSPANGKYTTVYWHVDPVTDVSTPGGFVPKGMQIATIADISTMAGSHLHFGVRMGSYDSTYSDKGALPTGYCSELVTFPENFIDPWDVNQILFQ